jgi:hypothetical protein
MIVIAEPA